MFYIKRFAEPYKYKYNGKELQDELGLNLYDYGARNYDPVIGRWLSIDPSATSYKSISPYAYVNNNSVNNIDPDGRDIIVLSAPGHVHNLGHAAVLIGNPKKGYHYYSKNGTTEHSGAYGKSNKDPRNGSYYSSLSAFEISKENKKDGPYTRAFEIKTSDETDKEMEKAANNAVKSDYHVLYQSCIDVASRALTAGGLNPGYTPDAYNPNSSLSSIPNIRFNNITYNNKGGTLMDLPVPTSFSTSATHKPNVVIVGPIQELDDNVESDN